MLQEELKKILIKQRVLFVLVILLVVQAGYIGFRGLYSHTVSKVPEKNNEIYEEYSHTLQGKWNPEKDARLDEWLQKLDKCTTEYNTLVDKMLKGEITDEILYKYYKKTPFCQNQYVEVLDELDQQRMYIKENPNQRYMMKTNGWIYFFEDHLIYVLYFVLLLVLYVPLFIREKESQMNLLQSLSATGQGHIFFIKILASWITMFSGLLLMVIEKYVLYHLRCGLRNVTYPIQSLSIFSDCPWRVSIGVAIIVEILLLGCAGYLFCGIVTLCSTIVPRTIEVCFFMLILVFVPMFLVSEELLFRYPILTSLLYPKQLTFGWRDINIGEMVYKSQSELVGIGVVTLLLGAIILLLAKKRGQKI